MYGEVPKTEAHKKIDEQFIQEVVASEGTKEKAAEHFLQRGWAYFYHDSLDISMKRFNQVWLLTPDDPEIFFGFARLMEEKGDKAQANRFYKMALAKDINHDKAQHCYQKISDCREHIKLLHQK